MNHVDKQRGFTLIELVLAMSFISVLLLAIALTIIQVGTIYNRGMTLKEVNQTARTISDDLTRSLSSSEAFMLSSKYIALPTGGRLCLGQYSYIWNYSKSFQDSNRAQYVDSAQNAKGPIRFVKVPDASGAYCVLQTNGKYLDIQAADTTKAVELLKAGDRTLSIHQFAITSGTNAKDPITGQQLYNLSFTIGTGNVSALTSDQTSCLPPNDPNSDFAYCTVQQFKLVVRAGDRVN
ncbi:MAG: prepilin-type N-terminal cleavage/methylation domain-containing protein [Candidatus Microsaccharimonas sp.]